MRGLIIVAALFVAACAQNANDARSINSAGCGKRITDMDPSHVKVVGGQRADPEDWGWQVSMNYTGRFICGGSIINSQWVLTAAHCVQTLTGSSYSFDIGHHDRASLEPWAQTRRAVRVIRHPQYSSSTFKNDIALFKLESPVTYSRQIVPVCVPDGQVNYGGRQSWATGWGTLRSGGSVSRYLMEVQMPFLTDTRCKQKYSIADIPTMVCAGETGENKDTCQGDSGGPLVVQHTGSDSNPDNVAQGRWFKAGITSWGYGCGDGGVYARTSQYYQWIKDQIANN